MNVSFVIRLHKSDSVKNADGKYPVCLQITWNRKVRRKRLGMYASVDQWDFDNHEFSKGVHGRRENNQLLEETLSKAERFFEQNEDEYRVDDDFRYVEFVRDFFEKPKQKEETVPFVAEFCKILSREFLSSNQAKSAEDYKYTGRAVLKVAPDDISFDDFNETFLSKLKQHFIDKGVKGYNHFVRLRAVYTQAIERRYVTQNKYPFKNKYLNPFGFDINKVKKLRVSGANQNRIKDMPIDEIVDLYAFNDMTKNERFLIQCYWFFSFFNFGVNLTDIARLRYKHLRELRWFYGRNKTGIGLKKGKPLIQEAVDIIEKYGRFGLDGDGEEYVFDILVGKDNSEAEIVREIALQNNRIRHACTRVSKRMGKNGYFTFMSARYSAITHALNSGADRNTVSHLADHANFSTLDHYAGRADDEKVVKAMEVLSLKDKIK